MTGLPASRRAADPAKREVAIGYTFLVRACWGGVTNGEMKKLMLDHIYHKAFDAHADIQHSYVTDDHAVLEATFAGKHIGEFAGVAATNKDVQVPLCVTYDLDNDGLIKEARIYMLTAVMMQQLQGQ